VDGGPQPTALATPPLALIESCTPYYTPLQVLQGHQPTIVALLRDVRRAYMLFPASELSHTQGLRRGAFNSKLVDRGPSII